MPNPFLTIVVPAFNEESRITPSLAAIVDYAGKSPRPVEIIVVDDGSTDRTAAVAYEALESVEGARVIANGVNKGKGYSVRHGLQEAGGEVVLFSDADLSTPITETDRLLSELEGIGHGIVIGSRGLKDSNVEVHQNPMRELMGKVFNRIVRTLTGLPFHDTQCGFKMMTRSDVEPVFAKLKIDGFSYDVELLYVAVRKGIPIKEVPVIWRNAPGSKVGILTDSYRMFRDVFRIRRWYRQGHYNGSKK